MLRAYSITFLYPRSFVLFQQVERVHSFQERPQPAEELRVRIGQGTEDFHRHFFSVEHNDLELLLEVEDHLVDQAQHSLQHFRIQTHHGLIDDLVHELEQVHGS